MVNCHICQRHTTLCCCVHRKPVCTSCLVQYHPICTVKAHAEWLRDSEYAWPPECGICRSLIRFDGARLKIVRLACCHVLIHETCLALDSPVVCPTCQREYKIEGQFTLDQDLDLAVAKAIVLPPAPVLSESSSAMSSPMTYNVRNAPIPLSAPAGTRVSQRSFLSSWLAPTRLFADSPVTSAELTNGHHDDTRDQPSQQSVETRIKQLENDLDTSRQQCQTLEIERNQRDADLQSALSELRTLQQKVDDVQSSMTNASETIRFLEDRVRMAESAKLEADQHLFQLQRDLETQRHLQEQSDAIHSAELRECQEEMESNTRSHQHELKQWQQKTSDLQHALDSLRHEVDSAKGRHEQAQAIDTVTADLRCQLATKEDIVQSLRSKVEELQVELSQKDATIAQIHRELQFEQLTCSDALRECEEKESLYRQTLTQLEQKLQEAKTSSQMEGLYQRQIEQLKAEIKGLEAPLSADSVKNLALSVPEEASSKKQLEDLSAALAAKQIQVFSLEEEIINLEATVREQEVQISSLTSEGLSQSVALTEQVHSLRQQLTLRDQQLADAESRIRHLEAECHRQTTILSEYEQVKQNLQTSQIRLAELEGDKQRLADDLAAAVAGQDAEEGRLNEALVQREQEVQVLQAHIRQLQSDFETQATALTVVTSKRTTEESEHERVMAELQVELSTLRTQLQEACAKRSAAEAALVGLRRQMAEAEQAVQASERTSIMQHVTESMACQTEQLEPVSHSEHNLSSTLEELQELKELKEQLAEERENSASLQRDLEDEIKSAGEMHQQIRALELLLAQKNAELETMGTDIKNDKETIDRLTVRLAEQSESLAAMQADQQSVEERWRSKYSAVLELKSERERALESADDRDARKEAQLDELRKSLEDADGECWKVRLQLQTLQQQYHETANELHRMRVLHQEADDRLATATELMRKQADDQCGLLRSEMETWKKHYDDASTQLRSFVQEADSRYAKVSNEKKGLEQRLQLVLAEKEAQATLLAEVQAEAAQQAETEKRIRQGAEDEFTRVTLALQTEVDLWKSQHDALVLQLSGHDQRLQNAILERDSHWALEISKVQQDSLAWRKKFEEANCCLTQAQEESVQRLEASLRAETDRVRSESAVEINHWKQKYEQALKPLTTVGPSLERVEAEVLAERQTEQVYIMQLEQLNAQLRQATTQLDAIQGGRLQSMETQVQREVEEQTRRLQEYIDENRQLKRLLQEEKESLGRLSREVEDLQRQLAIAESQAIRRRSMDSVQSAAESQLLEQLDALQDRLNTEQSKSLTLDETNQILQQKLTETEEAVQRSQENVEELEQLLQAARAMSSLRDPLTADKAWKAREDDLLRERRKVEQEVDRERRKRDDLETKQRALMEDMKSLKMELKETRRKLNASEREKLIITRERDALEEEVRLFEGETKRRKEDQAEHKRLMKEERSQLQEEARKLEEVRRKFEKEQEQKAYWERTLLAEVDDFRQRLENARKTERKYMDEVSALKAELKALRKSHSRPQQLSSSNLSSRSGSFRSDITEVSFSREDDSNRHLQVPQPFSSSNGNVVALQRSQRRQQSPAVFSADHQPAAPLHQVGSSAAGPTKGYSVEVQTDDSSMDLSTEVPTPSSVCTASVNEEVSHLMETISRLHHQLHTVQNEAAIDRNRLTALERSEIYYTQRLVESEQELAATHEKILALEKDKEDLELQVEVMKGRLSEAQKLIRLSSPALGSFRLDEHYGLTDQSQVHPAAMISVSGLSLSLLGASQHVAAGVRDAANFLSPIMNTSEMLKLLESRTPKPFQTGDAMKTAIHQHGTQKHPSGVNILSSPLVQSGGILRPAETPPLLPSPLPPLGAGSPLSIDELASSQRSEEENRCQPVRLAEKFLQSSNVVLGNLPLTPLLDSHHLANVKCAELPVFAPIFEQDAANCFLKVREAEQAARSAAGDSTSSNSFARSADMSENQPNGSTPSVPPPPPAASKVSLASPPAPTRAFSALSPPTVNGPPAGGGSFAGPTPLSTSSKRNIMSLRRYVDTLNPTADSQETDGTVAGVATPTVTSPFVAPAGSAAGSSSFTIFKPVTPMQPRQLIAELDRITEAGDGSLLPSAQDTEITLMIKKERDFWRSECERLSQRLKDLESTMCSLQQTHDFISKELGSLLQQDASLVTLERIKEELAAARAEVDSARKRKKIITATNFGVSSMVACSAVLLLSWWPQLAQQYGGFRYT